MTKAPMTQPTEAHADIVKQAERNAGWRDERFQCITDPALLLDLAAEITRLRTELAEITDDIDRDTIAHAVEEAGGFILSDAEIARWRTVGDVEASLRAHSRTDA